MLFPVSWRIAFLIDDFTVNPYHFQIQFRLGSMQFYCAIV